MDVLEFRPARKYRQVRSITLEGNDEQQLKLTKNSFSGRSAIIFVPVAWIAKSITHVASQQGR